MAVPARVARLLGDETSETAPCRAAVGAVEAHRDRYADGSVAAGNVSVVYLSAAPATFVLVDAATGDETRVPLAAGTALRWPNERYSHRVDAPPGAARALLGPASRRGGGGLEGVGNGGGGPFDTIEPFDCAQYYGPIQVFKYELADSLHYVKQLNLETGDYDDIYPINFKKEPHATINALDMYDLATADGGHEYYPLGIINDHLCTFDRNMNDATKGPSSLGFPLDCLRE